MRVKPNREHQGRLAEARRDFNQRMITIRRFLDDVGAHTNDGRFISALEVIGNVERCAGLLRTEIEHLGKLTEDFSLEDKESNG